MPLSNRSYVAGNVALNLAGAPMGLVKSVEGGGVTGEVVTVKSGPGLFTKKHLSAIRYEDFVIQTGLSMENAIYDWIAASWQMNYARKNGSILAADYNGDVKTERQFFNALITETTIPPMDGSSKEQAYLTIKLQPETVQYKKGSGKISGNVSKAQTKNWLQSNFRLAIDGLDCSKVSKIDSFTVKQSVVQDAIGDARDYAKEPAKLEIPNLKVTLSQAIAQTWIDWHDDFVIKGNNDESHEKNGSLTFLSPNMTTELGRVLFFNLGIFRLTEDEGDPNTDSIKRVSAEMYCERMEFQYGSKA